MKGIKIYIALYTYIYMVCWWMNRQEGKKRREENIRYNEMCYKDVYIVYIKNQNMFMPSWIESMCYVLYNIKRTVCTQFKSLK